MDGEKERRNLLVISTAILLFFWLDLPEGVIAERVLGQDIKGQISYLKVWSAVVVALLYQIHRWLSGLKDVKKFNEAVAQFDGFRNKAISKEVERDLDFVIKKEFSRLKILSIDKIRERYRIATDDDNLDVAMINSIEEMAFLNGVWKGRFNFTGRTSTFGQAVKCDFVYPGRRKLWLDIRIAHKFLVSRYSSEYVIPAVASYSALWLAVWYLTSAAL